MLGWLIIASRFEDERLRSARCELEAMRAQLAALTGTDEVPASQDEDLRLAVWQTGLGGTDWLDHLVAAGEAAKTSRAGYPDTYLVRFRDLRERLDRGLLRAGVPWRSGVGDSFASGYLGADSAFPQIIADTDSGEWVLLEAWDES